MGAHPTPPAKADGRAAPAEESAAPPDCWENVDLPRHLEACPPGSAGWTAGHATKAESCLSSPPWSLVADTLRAACVYE
ncbi:DUF7660 family protein [Micromonospora polyrhachis]|uniref:DUF7660 family protein n=1 Tax=Micromonospora polyrhachis TaxID=1282883 RepID=UPI00406BC87F